MSTSVGVDVNVGTTGTRSESGCKAERRWASSMAAAGLGIGLLRAIVVQLSGRPVAFDNLVMGVTLYAGGFIVAGRCHWAALVVAS